MKIEELNEERIYDMKSRFCYEINKLIERKLNQMRQSK